MHHDPARWGNQEPREASDPFLEVRTGFLEEVSKDEPEPFSQTGWEVRSRPS